MAFIVKDYSDIYERQFGTKPVVPSEQERRELEGFTLQGQNPGYSSTLGSTLLTTYMGREIWLPIKFYDLDRNIFGASEILLPYATLDISAKKTIVKTPLAERQGTVKELYSVDDYQIGIKGFVIGYDSTGKYPQFPEQEIKQLNDLFLVNEALKIDNAILNICMPGSRVVIEELKWNEPEGGGRRNYRSFQMKLESDTVFTLEL